MKSRLFFGALLGATVCSTNAWAQAWVGNRDLEGPGIRTGNWEMHPGISIEGGYDSNYFQRADSEPAGPVVGTARLRITPAFVMRTVDKRLTEGGAVVGAPPLFHLQLSADATGNLFFSDQVEDERHISGGVGAEMKLLPDRPWTFDLNGAWRRIIEPSNLPGFVNSYDRDAVYAGAGVTWSPGGGLFQWRIVGYELRATIFDQDQGFTSFNNLDQRISTRGRWMFLPRSAAVFDGQYRFLHYTQASGQNNGDSIQARVGYNGLVLDRLSILAMGGWAASFYDNDVPPVKQYDGLIANAELRWFLTAHSSLGYQTGAVGLSSVAIGYARTFNNSYLGDFYQSDRGYGQLTYMIGGVVYAGLEAGFAHISYPSFSIAGTGPDGRFIQPGFSEDRVDAKLFAEYRPLDSLGINTTLSYDQNFSKTIPLSETNPTVDFDDLSFQRWQMYLGVRWFL